MRKLIIHRDKSLAGCLGRVRVYIEDAQNGEMEIRGKRCRKLGELKNGEEKSFPISDEAAVVFVIADAATRDFCGDVKRIPAGETDVRLSGKNRFDPQNGNPFAFNP